MLGTVLDAFSRLFQTNREDGAFSWLEHWDFLLPYLELTLMVN